MSSAYDLVVLDLDGTILDPHREVPIRPAVVEAVRAVQRRGVGVTLATGRTLDYVRLRTADLDIRLPVITSQGAILGDPQTGQVLFERLLGLDVARSVAAWAAARSAVATLYLRDDQGKMHILQNREVRAGAVYDHWFGADRRIEPDWDRGLDGSWQPVKFIVVSAPEEADLVPELRARFGEVAQIVRTHPFLIEGTAPGVDKGSGLTSLLEMLSIRPQRVLAVGDHENDVPMFRVAGTAVAMGQADLSVRQAAHWVAPSVDDDGAAVALRRFILEAP